MPFEASGCVTGGVIMLIERLRVHGLLSFGPKGIDLPLEPLNVIIGPNGSGKSNLLQTLGLLRTAASGGDRLFNRRNWEHLLWRGPPHVADDAPAKAIVVATVKAPEWEESRAYSLELFLNNGQRYKESIRPAGEFGDDADATDEQRLLNSLHRQYAKIRLYNNWTVGAYAAIRNGQGPPAPLKWETAEESSATTPPTARDYPSRRDLYDAIDYSPHDGYWLNETAANLPGVISRFTRDRRDTLAKHMDRLYDGIVDISAPFEDGKASVVIEERNGRRIPAERLSDGTLRYLSLLTILLDPDPPPLIGIEEPELGLHPDIVFELSKLLVEASERTQLVVTTHSPALIDALTDHPTSVVACDKHEGQTWFKRVTPGVAEVWLNDNSLGEVWSMGGIGGNRW